MDSTVPTVCLCTTPLFKVVNLLLKLGVGSTIIRLSVFEMDKQFLKNGMVVKREPSSPVRTPENASRMKEVIRSSANRSIRKHAQVLRMSYTRIR